MLDSTLTDVGEGEFWRVYFFQSWSKYTLQNSPFKIYPPKFTFQFLHMKGPVKKKGMGDLLKEMGGNCEQF